MGNKLKGDLKKVAIITNNVGCERHVQYYSTVEKYFIANNWIVSESFDVDKVIICACGFHDFMLDKVQKLLTHLATIGFPEKDIIIAGCLPKTHGQSLEQNIHGDCIELNQEHLLDGILGSSIPFRQIIPPNVFLRPRDWQAYQDETFYIKISHGCLQNCAYCVINKAKGRLQSIPAEEIKEQFKFAISKGYKEIFLMGEDTLAYGVDTGTNIIALVNSLLEISADISLLFGNWHIRWLPQYYEEILRLSKQGIIKRLSIGLQHVNETLLWKMGRPINFAEIYGILQRLHAECPDLYLSADIMVGFPGETSEMFDELIAFFEQDTVFNIVAHFGYSDVQGSLSSKFDNKVNSLLIGSRWNKLKNILQKRSFYSSTDESDVNRTAFLMSFDREYTFCKDTYSPKLETKIATQKEGGE
jgi:MiaB/RimO family radical SAM methylthiotransferase